MKIGVISDTHGFLDPRIPGLFRGVDHILHAGDIGPDSIVGELESVAPVTAVCGNTDSSPRYSLTETVALAGLRFLVHHIVNPRELTEELRLRIARERPAAVIFGHTHQALWLTLAGVHYLNPGYAGKPKSGSERSVAILHVNGSDLRPEFLKLG